MRWTVRLSRLRGRRTEQGVPAARAFVEAMLGLQVWANTVHRQVTAGSHAHFAERDHH
jgi:hypothetical protein